MNSIRIRTLVKKAIVEARIRKWFNESRKNNISPSNLLTTTLRPKRGINLHLTKREKMKFIEMISRIYETKKIILRYKKNYSRKPKLFYKKVFGFPPRKFQSLKIIWGAFNIHFILKRNDLMAFWRKVQWGPGSGGFYPGGDTDIKIPELRGLISFGREEKSSLRTREIIRHESVHAFEDHIKGMKSPSSQNSLMFHEIKSELNAYLHNFKPSKRTKIRRINEWARLGLGSEVKEIIENQLSYAETQKRIKNLQSRIRQSKTKKNRNQLNKKLKKLKERLEQKRNKRSFYMSLHRKTVNQVKRALEVMPVEVLQKIINRTSYYRLHKKISESIRIYKRMKYEWCKFRIPIR